MRLNFGIGKNVTSIPEPPKPLQGFAYLFARFPSFTQTFCFREVDEMLRQGLRFPIFSIRKTDDEAPQAFPPQLSGLTTYLPDDILSWAKKASSQDQKRFDALETQLEKEWGDTDKKRAQEAAWLIPILEKLGIWHVHVHFAGLAARTAYWLKRKAGIRYSFTAHANDFLVDSEHARLEDVFREAEFVVTVSDFSAELLRERFPKRGEQIHRVYNGIPTKQFAEKKIRCNPPRILSVGRYIEKKGFSNLIRACALLKEENFECLIVGEGPLEGPLKEQIRKAGLDGRVFITGPRTAKEVTDLLSGTSLFVLACQKAQDGGMDNLPTVIMEAMATSVPIIATKLGGIPEMVIHGKTGYLVDQGDGVALAAAMRHLLQNPAAADRMGELGRVLSQERFDISVTVRSLKSLLTRYGGLRGLETSEFRSLMHPEN